jgi:hypothetical protein
MSKSWSGNNQQAKLAIQDVLDMVDYCANLGMNKPIPSVAAIIFQLYIAPSLPPNMFSLEGDF